MKLYQSIKGYAQKYQGIISDKLSVLSIPNLTGMVSRNWGRHLVPWFDKLGHPVVGTTRTWIRTYKAFAKAIYKLYKGGGLKYVVLYLKACSTLLQQAVGGQRLLATQSLGCAVTRTKSGLPRIIPAHHRTRILRRERDVVRLWLSLFNLYRVIEIPGKLKLSTITAPGVEIASNIWLEVRGFLPVFAAKLAEFAPEATLVSEAARPDHRLFKPEFQASPFMIAKSSPSTRAVDTDHAWRSTSVAGIINSAVLLQKDNVLWPIYQKLTDLTYNPQLISLIKKINIGITPEVRKQILSSGISLGKLGLKEEPAGKVRVFAMVDCWTQWILKPLHQAIFQVLHRIPQDGTFDQTRPIHRLIKKMQGKNITKVYSYDLSAATDRLPLDLQVVVLENFVGRDYALAWGELLVKRGYRLKSKDYNINTVLYYAVGQPMGALSSWAMLALTHHFIVQWAYWRICRREGREYRWFSLYAVLGDDIVIADEAVAKEYLKIMTLLGVEIGLAKSLISDKGVLEFAKKLFLPEDASMIPFKELLVATRDAGVMIEFGKKYNLTIPDFLHLLGFGYKVKGSLHKPFLKLGLRVRKLLIYILSPFVNSENDLRKWITMESLVKTTDQARWDRIYQSFFDKSIDALRDAMSHLEKRVRVLREYELGFALNEPDDDPSLTEEERNLAAAQRRHVEKYLSGMKWYFADQKVAHIEDNVDDVVQHDNTNLPPGYNSERDGPRPYTSAFADASLKAHIPLVRELIFKVYGPAVKGVFHDFLNLQNEFVLLEARPLPDDPFTEIDQIWKQIEELRDKLENLPIPDSFSWRDTSLHKIRAPLGKIYRMWSQLGK